VRVPVAAFPCRPDAVTGDGADLAEGGRSHEVARGTHRQSNDTDRRAGRTRRELVLQVSLTRGCAVPYRC
jgi:hypothetical protein